MASHYEMKAARAAASKLASAVYAPWREAEASVPEQLLGVVGKLTPEEYRKWWDETKGSAEACGFPSPESLGQPFTERFQSARKRQPNRSSSSRKIMSDLLYKGKLPDTRLMPRLPTRAASAPRMIPSNCNCAQETQPRLKTPPGSNSSVSPIKAACGKSLKAAGFACTHAPARCLGHRGVGEKELSNLSAVELLPVAASTEIAEQRDAGSRSRPATPPQSDAQALLTCVSALQTTDHVSGDFEEKIKRELHKNRSDPDANHYREAEVLDVLQCQHCQRPFPVQMGASSVPPAAAQEEESLIERAARLQHHKDTILKKAREKFRSHEEQCRQRRCQHCCSFFKTALECHGHSIICAQNAKYRCEFCSLRVNNLGEKRAHEATCEQNPGLWCDWCGTRFPHVLLRNRHQRACPRDPRKMCRFCHKPFPNRHDTVVHEVACSQNPGSHAVQAVCVACCEEAQCYKFPCGAHFYCTSCIDGMVDVGLKDRSLLPLRCCKREVQPGDEIDIAVGQMLSESKREKYQEAMLLKKSKNLMYCPRADCGALIALDNLLHADIEVDGPFGCPKCAQALCFTCKTEWHAGLSCNQYQFLAKNTKDPFIKYCREMHFMRCLDCGHAVEKKSGCNHITCVCGSNFCYICGARWGECRCQVMGDGHLLRHNRTGAVQYFTCEACRQAYPSEAELRAHRRVCRRAIEASGGSFECSNCLSRHATGDALRAHRRRCWAVQQDVFGCSHCREAGNSDYMFADQGTLRRHRRLCGDVVAC